MVFPRRTFFLTGVEVEDLRTGARRELFCDGLFVAIGRVPDTALFAGQVELDPSGYIVADETTRTSVPGVFAVGDARTKAVRQIVTAVADGAVASCFEGSSEIFAIVRTIVLTFHYLCRKQDAPRKTMNKFPFSSRLSLSLYL